MSQLEPGATPGEPEGKPCPPCPSSARSVLWPLGPLSGPGGRLQQAVCEAPWGPGLLQAPLNSRVCEVRVWPGLWSDDTHRSVPP